MNYHMRRTTLILDEHCFLEIKRVAVAQRRTLSDLVNELLRTGLAQLRRRRPPRKVLPLPSFDMGPPAVHLADRDELYRLMEGR